MSRSAEIFLDLGVEERKFRLTPVRWEKVQEACDAGPPEIARRLAAMAVMPKGYNPVQMAAAGGLGSWRIQDVKAPLVQGLIGGGMKDEDAGRLVRELLEERPLIDFVPIALAVVMASIVGAKDEDEPPGEPKGSVTRGRSRRSPKARSASPSSMGTPRRSA